MNESLNNKIFNATKWASITELLSKVINPFLNLILARLLAPEIFGTVATLSLVVTFAEVFTDAGFQKYLVQHQFTDETDKNNSINVAFWTNFIFSCIIWVAIFLFRDQIAILVGSEGYGKEIAVMSLNIPLVALSSIQTAIYRKQFRFRQLFPIRIITCLVPIVVTLPIAAIYRNCWSIIIGNLAKEIVFATALTVCSEWKPKFYYSFAKLKEMLSFSLTMMADSFMIWFTSYSGTLIVSRFLNDYYTGIYKTGITTISTYMNLIYAITAPVLFSALSESQQDRAKCNTIYYNFQRYCSLLVIPLGFGIFMYRDLATQILLGNQWGEASLILGVTALCSSLVIVTAQFNSDYFRAQGKPKIALLVQSLYAVAIVAILPLAVEKSFAALSIVQPCLGLIYSLVSTITICLVFKVSFLRVVGNIISPLAASVIMAGFAYLMQQVQSGMIWSIFSVILCAALYLIILLILPATRRELLSMPFVKKNLMKLGVQKRDNA